MVILPMEEYLIPMGTLGALKYQDKFTRQAVSRSIVIALPDKMNYENANSLRDSLVHFFLTHTPNILLLDVTDVRVMDSQGLGVLLYTIRTAALRQIKVVFCGHPNCEIADLLCLANLQGFNECPILSNLIQGSLWNAAPILG